MHASYPLVAGRVLFAALLSATSSAVANPTGNADSVFDLFNRVTNAPVSLISGAGTFSYTARGTTSPEPYSGSSWANGLNEALVFEGKFSHVQPDGSGNPIALRSFDLRLGRGGQIYSMVRNGAELVPPQYRESPIVGTNYSGGTWAPWMDDVVQPVLVNAGYNVQRDPYYIHGAGVYRRTEVYFPSSSAAGVPSAPFYSPILAQRVLSSDPDRSVSFIGWPQHAHIPTKYRSPLINYTRYRDAGGGVIEVTYMIHNFGGSTVSALDTITSANFPWALFRQSVLKTLVFPAAGSTYEAATPAFRDNAVKEVNSTLGWAFMTEQELAGGTYAESAMQLTSGAVALVYGFDVEATPATTPPTSAPPLASGKFTRLRYGFADTKPSPSTADNAWRNSHVFTAVRPIQLMPGETFFSRYYLVFGSVTHVKSQIENRSLVSKATYGEFSISAASDTTVPLITWYSTSSGLTTTSPGGGATPVVTAYALPVNGSTKKAQPLFLMRDSAEYFLTTDPYAVLSATRTDAPPYQQNTYDPAVEYVGFAGYYLANVGTGSEANSFLTSWAR